MMIKSSFLFLLILLNSFLGQSQISDFKEKFELPSVVEETSGLLFLDGKIITNNDSGDAANLYEIDSLTGNLLRTININNATNVDWEDLADDETYIYIGDFGNNNGTRTDLKIYRILKTDFKNNTQVSPEIISFSYEDQSNFNSSNSHNFDAEAFVVYEDSILIFTKNRGDLKTNVYKIPKIIGNYTAVKVSSANVAGLITGATYNGNFLLCGYDENLTPFLVQISYDRAPGDDIFSSGFTKEFLTTQLGQGSQVEAITSFELGKYYISREFFSTSVGGFEFTFPQKLYEFTDARDFLLSTERNNLDNFKIYPNPTSNKLYLNSKKAIKKVSLFNIVGDKILSFNSDQKEINISHFSKGIYILRIQFKDNKSVVRKIIKL
tara:strand:+ start:1914 stop:3053 length:1140 start_codon:yes stop_codon:yes gene_type:complete